MLEAALAALNGHSIREELAVVAVELLRLGLLNTNSVTGAPVPQSGKDTPRFPAVFMLIRDRQRLQGEDQYELDIQNCLLGPVEA